MLIRSQDKERIMDYIRASVGIDHEVSEGNDIWISIVYSENACGLLGKYSSKEKALKVLDMIQEAYEEACYAEKTVAELLRKFSEVPKVERDKKILYAIRESFKKTTCFQMPEDSEVQA